MESTFSSHVNSLIASNSILECGALWAEVLQNLKQPSDWTWLSPDKRSRTLWPMRMHHHLSFHFLFTLASHYAHSLPKSERYHVTNTSCRVPLGTVEPVNPVGKHQLDGTSALLEGDVPEGLFFIRWQAIYELLVYRALGTHPQSFNLCCSSCLLSYTQLDPHRRMERGRAEGGVHGLKPNKLKIKIPYLNLWN